MSRKTWKDVDWVELGCRGWEIDETGAGLFDPPEGPEAGFRGHVHLDWATLDLMLQGPPEWVERVYDDLRAAAVLSPPSAHWWWVGAAEPSSGTGTVTYSASTGSGYWRRIA